MRYLALDIETTGLDPFSDQVLSVAIIVEDTNHMDVPIEELPTFHTYIIHERIHGDPYAIMINAKIMERIALRTKGFAYDNIDEFQNNLSEFLRRHRFRAKEDGLFHVTAGGKNVAGFDIPFLTSDCSIDRVIKFAHRCVDPANLYFDPLLDSELECKLPSLKECCKRAGFDMEAEHTELGDCRDVIRLMRHKWKKEN